MLLFGLYILIVLVISSVLIALGVGVGTILHWLVPAIDLGVGTLIGIAALLSAFSVLRSVNSMVLEQEREDEGIEIIPGPRPGSVTYLLDPLPPLPGRRRHGGRSKQKP